MKVHSEVRDNDEKDDVEAAVPKTVTGIVLGVDTKEDGDDNGHTNSAPAIQRENDFCIFFMTFFYILLVVAVFVWPRVNANRSNVDGLDDFVAALSIVIVVGGLALIVATLNLLITASRWPRLTTASKLAGVFPVMSSIVIIVTIVLLVKIHARNEEDNHIPDCYSMNTARLNSTWSNSSDYYPCKFPTNESMAIWEGDEN